MPIAEENLRWYLSGGTGNTDPNASIGGAPGSQLGEGLDNLFADVSGDEAAAGSVKYRCVYFVNEDPNLDGLLAPIKAWIAADVTSPTTQLEIGLDPAGKNTAAQEVDDEDTEPSGVTFSEPTSKGSGISLPDAPYVEGDYVAVWVRRTVAAGSTATPSDAATLRVEGDTV